MTEPSVHIQGLVHAYDREPVLAVDRLELAGGRVQLLGPNGAGKTTLLTILATLQRPSRGRVEVAGCTLPQQAQLARSRVGFAGHEPSLHPALTTRQALAVHARLHGVGLDRIASTLEAWELASVSDLRVEELSFGQRRRLDLARSLLHEPHVLLLDEPETGLDPRAGTLLDERIRDREPALTLLAAPSPVDLPTDGTLEVSEGRLEGTSP